MSTVTLHHGDCLELLPTLPAGSIDAIITDLPYGTTACSWDAVIPFEPMWAQVRRLLKPRGVFVTTASQPFTSALVMSNREMFRYEWVWEKAKPTGFIMANRRPMKAHENVLVFSPAPATNVSNPGIFNPQGLSICNEHFHAKRRAKFLETHLNGGEISTDYIRTSTDYPCSILPFTYSDRDRVHPTQKPVALYEYLIRTYTNEGDTVLDFCAGSGTTGVACVQTGRNFIGIEIDENYYRIAEKRIAEAQQSQILFSVLDKDESKTSPYLQKNLLDEIK